IALGATKVDVTRFEASATNIEVDLTRVVPVDLEKLPAFARPFLSAEQTMRHDTRWIRTGPDVRARLTITAIGKPVRIVGTARLVARGERSRLSLEFEVTSDVPILGRRIAKLMAETIEAALEADHAYTLRYLERAG
ncbi:MAG: DUF2505 domain-containing protein, partial [Deltaproteobacteria bacterium]